MIVLVNVFLKSCRQEMGDEIFEWILHIVGNDAEKKNFCKNIENRCDFTSANSLHYHINKTACYCSKKIEREGIDWLNVPTPRTLCRLSIGSFENEPKALGILTQLFLYKRAESNLLADEKSPQQVDTVSWHKHYTFQTGLNA